MSGTSLDRLIDRTRLRFIDGSRSTKSDLDELVPEGRAHDLKRPFLDIEIERGDGMGVGAGHLDMPPNQVALGFSRGSDRAEAERFARRIRSGLEQRWHVEVAH